MSIHVALHHRTEYRYDRPVVLSPQVVRLRPAPHCRSRVLGYSLQVAPKPHFLNWQQDPQSNHLARLVFPERVTELVIEVDLVVEMAAMNPFDFFLEPYAETWPFEYEAEVKRELAPYLEALPSTPRVDALVDAVTREHARTSSSSSSGGPVGTADFLVSLNRKLSELVEYRVRLEPGLQTPEETLEKRSGSCRDSGWLLVALLRRLGFAARFVSGYLIQLVADVKPLEGPEGPSADFVDLHAWCEVYLPGAGWIGLDPTSGLLAGEGHLPLACAAEPSLAAPVSGRVETCESVFAHSMKVTRVFEVPRVTKPYTDEQWRAIEALGHRVDAALANGDVRLTMGGEPTFVAADDLDAAEWNTDALGPTKKRLGAELFLRLRDRYAPKGLVHHGTGKWYPGEPLPRWALNLYWRRDGEPIWNDPALLADESRPEGADAELARRFLQGVAARLGVDADRVFPAYEDVFYYLWRERRLPVNVDPFDAKLDDPLERARLRRVFTQGLDAVVGHVLPIANVATRHGAIEWATGSWFLRDDRCFLVPGDSPIGLRLPLDAQAWSAEQASIVPSDPGQPPARLHTRIELQHTWGSARDVAHASDRRAPPRGESAAGIVRTAMCAEPRDGVLHVFMPPVSTLEEYLSLVTAVEATASALSTRVIVEGYGPPRDARLVQLSVTPDPGVLEVNVHPVESWGALVDHTEHLYEAARLSRLAAEKFELDGRHVGTGGGNHVVLGGPTPADSPFLRRPDLLRSVVAYFHQHPSLSFLFSGMFLGPTSQAPRVDEARDDSVHELEIAFREVSRRAGADAPPWLVDRLFRDVLVDVTGNTHRAELCIDKMFSPDGPAGRLGLLELRGFEMPPHARMSLTQQLLLRALVARLWAEPFAPERLVRWGTELHDRFMLPHFVWQDLEDVLADLASAGFALDADWFAPHFEHRFPRIGDVVAKGVEIELRSALEPWHVMGEDATATGTARYVDSSLERVQVKATGMAPDRYLVTCNGVAVPLQKTGRNGEWVAGVRHRAWQPPRCLHPHIGVHSPLRFDLVDTWSRRSLGGCEYHVVHPGGRAHERRPVNALEAEGRRRARFFRMGHTPGTLDPKPPTRSVDFPFTLDLRLSP